ncbi:NigD-like protein [Draconibacterium sp. IB214405]|uniref:NigD-like protein n=1 Tax=Draconibacterium sp. IB214405 TaxID=3097352 RepID=UPI002A0E03AA|nr:NigD-like protein [Draconibacterium sp. IB214405]MDX8339196.1 NigD-like protein [Draconibacterium sp. IB214405]
MKKLAFGILMSLLVVFTGCLDDDDGYSLGDYWIGFGIYKGDGESAGTLVMDNNYVLVAVAANDGMWYENFSDGDRVLVNYTILDEDETSSSEERYYVKINDISDVLMKGILDITEEIVDSIGNDPIIVEDAWITDSLLSFRLKYWGYNQTHFLNLVKTPGELTAEDQPIQLELRHNANGDAESIPYTAYVSFSLNSLRINDLDSVQFEVTATDYEGDLYQDSGVFNYSDLELPIP